MEGKMPMFEEAKVSGDAFNDPFDIVNIIHRTFQENTLQTTLVLGFFMYFVMVYVFMLR